MIKKLFIILVLLAGCGYDYYPPNNADRTLHFRDTNGKSLITFRNVVRYNRDKTSYDVFYVDSTGDVTKITIAHWYKPDAIFWDRE
jgi:hypothetical protein